jgi:hypothetical protein
MFPDINPKHDFIQFETGFTKDKFDLAFIWDLKENKAVESIDKPS